MTITDTDECIGNWATSEGVQSFTVHPIIRDNRVIDFTVSPNGGDGRGSSSLQVPPVDTPRKPFTVTSEMNHLDRLPRCDDCGRIIRFFRVCEKTGVQHDASLIHAPSHNTPCDPFKNFKSVVSVSISHDESDSHD